ncbi:thiamine pyrophosphate-binding protein [Nocardia harenae]|uniref:thiamine pyrophosphate-binding protein n=1 Tax=Nocardia harenae TaxID=358707 RepID=UPI0008329D69|nr:thiamine pyrophosphate-dependent enzyme [Nocardia harenae]
MPDRVADHLVRAVAALGARQLFGVDGANIEDIYDAVFAAGDAVRAVVAKHEFSAATMADGFARASAGIGVVAATSGGGAMNLVPGLAESFTSRVPVLALIGQPPRAGEGNGAFQDTSGLAGTIDAEALFATITGYCARVRGGAELPGHLDGAALALRRGLPAALLLPKDIQQEVIELPAWTPPAAVPRHDTARLAEVRSLLAAARVAGGVLVLAGAQVGMDDARAELARLTGLLGAAVGVAPDAKDVYDQGAPGFRGVAGTMGHPELPDALLGASVCLLVGTTLPGPARTGLELDGVPVLSIGHSEPHPRALHAHSSDLRYTLGTLADALEPELCAAAIRAPLARNGTPPIERGVDRVPSRPPTNASPRITAGRGPGQPAANSHRDPCGPAHESASGSDGTPTRLPVPESTGPGLRYRAVVDAVTAALPPGSDVFADAGNTGASVVHHLRVPRDGRFVVALGMGGMGYAFGAAIGACLARGRRTVVIAGDGAFYMHGMEFHTAVQLELPLTVIVLDNSAHAMCLTREQIYYGDRYSFNRFRPAELGDGMAAMFPGLPAWSVRTDADLPTALPAAFDTEGPSFVAVTCDPDEIPPFLPFLSANPSRSTP